MSFNPRALLQLWEKLIPKSNTVLRCATLSTRQLKLFERLSWAERWHAIWLVR